MQVQIVRETFLKAITFTPERIHSPVSRQTYPPGLLPSQQSAPSFVFISLSCKYNIPTHVAA